MEIRRFQDGALVQPTMKRKSTQTNPPFAEESLEKLAQELEKLKVELARVEGVHRQEIIERKRTEEALRESEERFRIAAESASDLIWDWDLVTNRLEWFGDIDELLGYGPEEFPRTIEAWKAAIHPDDRDRVMYTLNQHLQKRTPYYEEYRVRQRLGEFRYWIDRGTALWGTKGAAYRMIGSCTDVTERKQSEEERLRLEAQLQQSQKMESIGRLVGGIAHDLNNLLSPILAYSEMILLNLKPADPRYEEAREIKRAAELARELIQRLLAFSRKQVLELKTINLGEVITEFERILRRTIREDIKIEIRVPSSSGLVRVDVGQIEQILLNLAVNAQEAMPAGGVLTIEVENVVLDEISASQYSVAAPGAYMMLSISDTGRGMDQVVLDRLFEPFFTTKEPGKGTGLGLPMVYGIVKQHAGHISVHSRPGHGTMVKIYLPRVKEKKPRIRRETPASREARPASETVVVVEDQEMVRDVASRILKLGGYEVIVAASVTECLELVGQHNGPIHLLLTDVIMPEMNGRELHRRLTSLRPGLKVLFMSGYTGDALAHRQVLEGGVNFIQKPFTIQCLIDKVREVLDS